MKQGTCYIHLKRFPLDSALLRIGGAAVDVPGAMLPLLIDDPWVLQLCNGKEQLWQNMAIMASYGHIIIISIQRKRHRHLVSGLICCNDQNQKQDV